jgi:hypothetical protein
VSVVPEYEDKEFGCICEGARAVVGKTAFDEPRLVALVAGCLPGGSVTDNCEVLTFMKEMVQTRVFREIKGVYKSETLDL